jgi:predicted RNase H-like HicB family nuclease
MKYVVVVEPGESGYYTAHAPAVPGCWSQGKDLQEAIANFKEALELHISSLMEDGLPLPENRGIEVNVVEVELA